MTLSDMQRDILLWREARINGYIVTERSGEYLVLSRTYCVVHRGSARECFDYVNAGDASEQEVN